MEISRLCRQCNCKIEYRSKKAFVLATNKDSICSRCNRLNTNQNQRKFNLDFLLENNLESAYFLGLIIADGTFSEAGFEITLQQRDAEVLLPRLSELCGGALIKDKVIRETTYRRLAFRNKESLDKVKSKFGFQPRKTYNPLNFKTFNKLDSEYLTALFIGIIDGDGSIYVSKNGYSKCISLTFHKNWLEFYIKLFDRLGIQCSKPTYKENSIRLTIGKRVHVEALNKFVKEKLSTKLNRKWQKLQY